MNLEKAIAIALDAHSGQTDKGGKPYILHPLRVMQQLETEVEQIVGVLHDVVEDSNYTFEDLESFGFPTSAIAAIKLVTKQTGVDYQIYLANIKSNPIARNVKLADLRDNMNLQRLEVVTEKDLQRQAKYQKAVQFLSN
ncbi:MAG: bifunctional (p)ppGpp synthetase/guanosine-3',5'-bis(diphosphate) 3'-pyrophosphohydrolase [Richelia sp. RM1_1_1]|nr:bifunctional (p)ppGpp synthetase/guanosine-3',5'-bis(diphosphate) 3'-pyrophosphohydrolase [Richelia sp. RM1_1_1]